MAHKLIPTIDFSDVSDRGKNKIVTYFKSFPHKDALYELISYGDLDLISFFLNEIGFSEENLKRIQVATELKNLLSEAYHQLNVKRVPVTEEMRSKVLNKLVTLHYQTDSRSILNSESQTKIELFKNIKMEICLLIKELFEIHQNKNKGNTFLFICFMLSFKLNSAKKLHKALSERNKFDTCVMRVEVPWDQIQFILNLFVYSYEHIETEGASLYLSVLTKSCLVEHLKHLLINLETLEVKDLSNQNNKKDGNNVKKIKGKGISAKQNNSNEVNGKIAESDENGIGKPVDILKQAEYEQNLCEEKMNRDYPNLFRDFWLVKNVYSLKIINEYIELALQVDFDSSCNISLLCLERCLLMIGEFTKCTPDCPHVSEDIKELISFLTAGDLQEIIIKIRNNLTHLADMKLGELTLPILKSSFNRIQFDFMKARDNLRNLYQREKIKIVRHFAENMRMCGTVTDIYAIYPEYILNPMLSELTRFEFRSDLTTVSYHYVGYHLQNIMTLANAREKKIIRGLLDVITSDNKKDAFLPLLLMSLKRHLSYISIIRNKNVEAKSYKKLLDVYLDNLISHQNTNDDKLSILVHGLHNLLFNCTNSELKQSAMKLYTYVTVSMNEIKGIRHFQQNVYNAHQREKSFVEAEHEINQIFNSIKLHLSSESDLKAFDDKITRELNVYLRITKLFDLVEDLNASGESIEEAKINEVLDLIGDQKSEIDLKIIQSLKDENIKNCLDLMKSKFKGKRKCKYESLVKTFMRPEHRTVQAKANLILEFIKGFDLKEFNGNIETIIATGYLSVLNQVFSDLEKVQLRLELYPDYKDVEYYEKLYAAREMILLKILKVSHFVGGQENATALLSLRPDLLLHCGKSLRNFLAHLDITYKLLSYRPEMIVPSIARSISDGGIKGIIEQNYLIRSEATDFDGVVEEEYYGIKYRDLISLQEEMFAAIMRDDLTGLERCIDSGSDPKGLSMSGLNALQTAFQHSSVASFNYLVERYEKIIISSSNLLNTWKRSLCLDISSSSDFIKLVKLTMSHNVIEKCDDAVEQAYIICDYINKKYATFSSRRSLVNYLHILVSLEDITAVEDACDLRMHRNSELDINGNHPIHWAASLGQRSICEILIDKGFPVNEANTKGHTPLDVAMSEHQWETVVFLMERGALKNLTIDPLILVLMTNQTVWINQVFRSSPFICKEERLNVFLMIYALSCCDTDNIGDLWALYKNEVENITKNNTDITNATTADLYNFIKWFILCDACFYGNVEIVKEISLSGYYKPDDYHSYDSVMLESLLYYNCYHKESCCCILEIIEFFTDNSPIHLACRIGGIRRNDIISILIRKYNINIKNKFGLTPLHTALFYRNSDVSVYLIENGADIDVSTPDGFTSIHISSYYGLKDVLHILVKKKVKLNVVTTKRLSSPVHLASAEGHHVALKLLIDAIKDYEMAECQAILNLRDTQGNTALHYAIGQRKLKSVKILLENGADHRIVNNYNHTCIDFAVNIGWESTLRKIAKTLPQNQRTDILDTLSEIKGKKA